MCAICGCAVGEEHVSAVPAEPAAHGAVEVLQGLLGMILAMSSGPMGLFVVLVQLTFDLLRLAIIIVVLVSWLPISPFSSWVRWAFNITEPFLRPLREIVPRLGMFDITPIVAYILLDILEWAFLRMVGM